MSSTEPSPSPFIAALVGKLKVALATDAIELIDNSWQHAGHVGNIHGGSHLAIRIVAQQFEGMGAMARHRLVRQLLADEMKERIHALELTLLAPSQV
jgi:BolA family transcriptional regulator, general stress-responsive regulator